MTRSARMAYEKPGILTCAPAKAHDYMDIYIAEIDMAMKKAHLRENHPFQKYDNTMEFSMQIIDGLLQEDLSAIMFIAPTQFGKTATMFFAVHALITHPDYRLNFPYPFVFVMTGLNSNSWKEQTQDRVLPCMAPNVWHNKDILQDCNKIRLQDAIMSDFNTLIVIDEVHVGSNLDNTIFKTLMEFHPKSQEGLPVTQSELFEFLAERRVKFLFVSATPDSIKECLSENWPANKFRQIIAKPESAETYIWHKHYLESGRVFDSYKLTDNDEHGVPFHQAIAQRISEYSRPLYHMIRFPMESKKREIDSGCDALVASLGKLNVDVDVIKWDGLHDIKRCIAERSNFFQTRPKNFGNMSIEDILKTSPKKHVVFVLKEMFRVAQTLPTKNIGVLVDRFTKMPNDSTLSQSLIGRACGHNKQDTINQVLIYTSRAAVIRYITLWANGFNYEKVPHYRGYGIKTNKKGTEMKFEDTMVGNGGKKKTVWEKTTTKEKVPEEKVEDTEDTPDRLERVRLAYNKKNTIISKIIRMYIEKGFIALTTQDLNNASKRGIVTIHHYITWNEEHAQVHILEKKDNEYVLRKIIKEHLKL